MRKIMSYYVWKLCNLFLYFDIEYNINITRPLSILVSVAVVFVFPM